MTRRPGVERLLFVYAPLVFALVFLLGPFYGMVITALKPNSELLIVVNLTVTKHPNSFILVVNRLMSPGQIDNAETAHP